MIYINNLSVTRATLPFILRVALLLLLACLGTELRAGTTHGPNILSNGGFEGGTGAWALNGPFTVVNNPANAHTGSYELQAPLAASPSYQFCYQTVNVWPNTNYVSTVWIKGSGNLEMGVLNTSNYQGIASMNIKATGTWQQVTMSWNSGAYGQVWVYFNDNGSGNTGANVYLDDCQTFLANGNDIGFNPANPGASGYNLVFDDEFNSASTIDTNNTGAPGFNWYTGQYFGVAATPPSWYSVGSGSLSILNNSNISGMTLHTTAPDAYNSQGYHGTSFSAGSGIYIEARMAMPNQSQINNTNGWPSFWGEDLKIETRLNEQMPGNPSDYEYIENDFLEYNPTWGYGGYISTIHDWSGTIASGGATYDTITGNLVVFPPVGTDLTQYHTYGTLWVPASASNGYIGYRETFFDGVAQSAVCWQGNQIGSLPPSGSYLFSVQDQDQFDLILGGCNTGTASLNVDYLHVYAVSPSSVTVVPPGPAGTNYGTSTIAGTSGTGITLTFQGLPGNPSGAVYEWYYNGTAIATTTTPTYTISNALLSQSGTYTVDAWAPGTPPITATQSFALTISAGTPTLTTSTTTLSVPDGSTAQFTAGLTSAPTGTTTVAVSISGTPALTVSPATLTMTPANYQAIPVTVTAAPINSNDSNRTAAITLATGTITAAVSVTDPVSDAQTASNLTATAYPLTGSNLGTGSTGDSSVRASGNWWIDGTGTGGITGAADSFHLESQSFTGNFQMVVQLQSLTAFGATSPLAGLMIRDGTAAGSNFLALAGQSSATGGYALVQRTTVNAAATETLTSGAAPLTYTYPAGWMELTRVGNVLHAFVSSDGVNFTEVTNPTTGVTWTGMSSSLSIGVFSASASTANARAVMNNFSISTPISAFTDQDIGGPAYAGSATVSGTTTTVSGGGVDIWDNADQFTYYSEPLTGTTQSMIVHVDSVAGASVWAKGGLMFRNSNTATSPFVDLVDVPGKQVTLMWRDTEGASANWIGQLYGDTVTPKWIMLTKSGSTFSAYYATTTGTPTAGSWTLIGTHSTTFANTTYLGGLMDCGNSNSVLGTSIYDNFTVSGLAPLLPQYSDADIGGPAYAGSAVASSNTITVSGGGVDIWDNSDQFNYDYAPLTGSTQTLVVHVDSVVGASVWAKGGLMFRNSTTPTSPFVDLVDVPGKQVTMMWRDTEGGSANWVGQLYGDTVTPKWIMLTKSGNTFSAYYATTTGTPTPGSWNLIATHSTTFANTTYLGGLMDCGNSNGVLGTAVYDSYSINGVSLYVPVPPAASTYTDTDIGNPPYAGSAAVNNGSVTVSGSGGDIWNNSDQFNYYYQPNTKDVTLTVHVDSVQNTSAWAKAGLMFRNSTTATSPYVDLIAVPGKQVAFMWRDTEGGSANWIGQLYGDGTSLKWLKLVKSGTTFTAYYATTTSTPGTSDWVEIGTHTTTFPSATYLGGLAITSDNSSTLCSATFDTLTQQ